jgi:hypothetical protein
LLQYLLILRLLLFWMPTSNVMVDQAILNLCALLLILFYCLSRYYLIIIAYVYKNTYVSLSRWVTCLYTVLVYRLTDDLILLLHLIYNYGGVLNYSNCLKVFSELLYYLSSIKIIVLIRFLMYVNSKCEFNKAWTCSVKFCLTDSSSGLQSRKACFYHLAVSTSYEPTALASLKTFKRWYMEFFVCLSNSAQASFFLAPGEDLNSKRKYYFARQMCDTAFLY